MGELQTTAKTTMGLEDGFFTSLENTKPFLKVAFQGMAGTGKTRTMAEVVIGLYKRIGSRKPICVVDTEKAAPFLRQLYAAHGIDPRTQIVYKESRTLADLEEVMRRGQDGLFDVLQVDSITHIYEDFVESYKRQKNRTRLQFEDWGVLKPLWKKKFAEPFVQHRYHALMCGREGYEYEDVKDPETGRREIHKSGVKMKVEGETAYEPDVLVRMTRHEDVLGAEAHVWREATVLKDRSGLLDGKKFRNPSYKDFAPAVDFLLEAPVVRDLRETENTFAEPEDAGRELRRRREILLEKVEATCVLAWPGRKDEDKRHKLEALRAAFGSLSWKEIENLHPDRLQRGLEQLLAFVASRARPVEVEAEVKPAPAAELAAIGEALGAAIERHAPQEQTAGASPSRAAEAGFSGTATPGPLPDGGPGIAPATAAPSTAVPSAEAPAAREPAPAPPAAPAPPLAKAEAHGLGEGDLRARLGKHDEADGWAKLVCSMPAADPSGALSNKILGHLADVHGTEVVARLFADVGGQKSGGAVPRRKALTFGQLRELLGRLPVAPCGRDAAAESPSPVAEALAALPAEPSKEAW